MQNSECFLVDSPEHSLAVYLYEAGCAVGLCGPCRGKMGTVVDPRVADLMCGWETIAGTSTA
jgi:hypothetical protein